MEPVGFWCHGRVTAIKIKATSNDQMVSLIDISLYDKCSLDVMHLSPGNDEKKKGTVYKVHFFSKHVFMLNQNLSQCQAEVNNYLKSI